MSTTALINGCDADFDDAERFERIRRSDGRSMPVCRAASVNRASSRAKATRRNGSARRRHSGFCRRRIRQMT